MPSTPQEIPLTFEKGLVLEVEESVLEQGQASELINWEPSPNGTLRTRNEYASISPTGLTSPYNTRGWGAIATGGSAVGAAGPQVVQTGRWPDGANTDAVSTKTITLNGITVGHILVAVVADNSGLTPTVTGGWTQRAVSTGNNQFVKFYTKTSASSTESFTYTISSARIREVTVYELVNIDGEDPGSNWAASNHSVGSGSDTLTVNTTDADGGIAIVGYHYDGGTPSTSGSGTSGYSGSSLDDSNSRTGVLIEDLDLLDGADNTTANKVTPSWTPPATGTLLMVIGCKASTSASLVSVVGNGLTWSTPTIFTGSGSGENFYYTWADLNAGSTTGSLTIDVAASGVNFFHWHFFHIIGGPDGVNPVQQTAFAQSSGDPVAAPLGANLQTSSGLIGIVNSRNTANNNFNPQADADDFESTTPLDAMSFLDNALNTRYAKTARKNSAATTDISPDWTNGTGTFLTLGTMEILGNGGASQARHGTYPTLGAVTEEYSYVNGKNITAKIVTWSSNPGATSSAAIEFYIVLAMAEGATTYSIYRILRNNITSGTWELIDRVTDATENNSWVSFAQGAGNLVWTSTSLTAPRAINLSTLLGTNITDLAGKAGRTAAYHKDRMFIAGAQFTPSRVYFSGIGTPTDFTTVTDYLDIGGDDGEAIQDLVSVEGLLLIPKTNRSYLVSGSGVESFFVNELPGGTAAAGKPAARTPYGTVLVGDDDVWVIQGGGVDPMSRPLGGEYQANGLMSTAYAQDMCLIADSATGDVLRLNLVTGAWGREHTRAGGGSVYTIFSLNGRIYYGTSGSTTQVGGTRKLSSSRNYDATTSGMDLSASTGRMSLVGPGAAYTPRYLYLQIRSQDPTKPNVLKFTVDTDLGSREFTFNANSDTQRFTRALGFAKGATWIKVSFECNSSPTAAAIDIERAVLGVDSEAR